MIITLKGANFSTNKIGTLSNWTITPVIDSGTVYSGVRSVKKGDPFSATLTLQANYAYSNGVEVTMGGGGTITKTENGNVTTISTTSTTGNITIKALTYNTSTGESGGGGEVVDPTPGDTTGTVTWEMGAINSGGGPNSTDMPKQRIRTAGYLQVESSITIKATGNVEFCPVYYRTDKTYISSPNKYQTTDCVVNASEYPLVRLMIRDKTSTSADLTSKLTELGNSIVITGNFVEIPYGSGEEPDEPETPTRIIPPLADTTTWYVGALNSQNGEVVSSMKTRLYSNRFALTSSPMTITVSGNAEICPVWYNSDGSMKSTPAVYQTTSITTTSTDGHSIAFMIRDKSNTNATLTTDFGSNVTISK